MFFFYARMHRLHSQATIYAKVDNTYQYLDYSGYPSQSNNCFIIHCFEENNDQHTIARNTV